MVDKDNYSYGIDEIIVPLNASRQFYWRTYDSSTARLIAVSVLGYYL
jgi:hypothetical protein